MAENAMSEGEVMEALEQINEGLEEPWSLRTDKLHKLFVFDDFVAAFGFMTQAAIQAEKMNHHPEWSNVYRQVAINLVTHEAGGITRLDFELAEKLEEVASRMQSAAAD